MSIVTFWSKGEEQTGKTLAMTAIGTYMAIEHNYRILMISTSCKDETIRNCFWGENKLRKSLGIFKGGSHVALGNGIDGLSKMIHSNRVAPENLTDYTRVVFKDRLEVLLGTNNKAYYDIIQENYLEIIKQANKYYDIVLVDLDNEINEEIQEQILNESDIIVATMSQRLRSINSFNEYKNQNPKFNSSKVLLLVGRYDKYSKYSVKNITRNYLREKIEICTIPYNTLYFEAAEEARVANLFLSLRNVKSVDDRNYFFMQEIKRITERIIYRLQDLQMRMGR